MSAMDAIVTRDKHGNFLCTPFYIMYACPVFTKAVMEKVIVEVNGSYKKDIHMYKDMNGEVYFEDDENAGATRDIKVPTDEHLRMMDLREGANDVKFIATTSHMCARAKIWLWATDVKLIVTDIDGTITRSDTRGHLYSRMGIKWHHTAVSDCFQKLSTMGYKIIYLTARSITMDTKTRKYLCDLDLPSGPLLLSPKTMMQAFTSEVISRDSKLGKFNHLMNVVQLFPNCVNPIVAGFGNNENDEWAYSGAGIPNSHIFILNKRSEIVCGHGRTSYESISGEICKFFRHLVHDLSEGKMA